MLGWDFLRGGAFTELVKLSQASHTMIQKDCKISVRQQSELLGVNRSGFCYLPILPDEEPITQQKKLMRRIDYWHVKFPYFGSRKINVKFREDGYKVGRKTSRCLKQLIPAYAIYPKGNLPMRNFKESIVPHLLKNYAVNFPNQVWPIGMLYISYTHGHMYLNSIIDWYSRKK